MWKELRLFLDGRGTTVIASPGSQDEGDTTQEITYSDARVIGNGSFGVVYQATLISSDNRDVAIKKVLQDKRFKVSFFLNFVKRWPYKML